MVLGPRTEQIDIAGFLPRHWLYEWFSQFHSCGTYSVLSRSPSITNQLPFTLDITLRYNMITHYWTSRQWGLQNRMKKRSETQTLHARAGCRQVWTPPAHPLSQTHRQDRLQYTAPQLASVQCNNWLQGSFYCGNNTNLQWYNVRANCTILCLETRVVINWTLGKGQWSGNCCWLEQVGLVSKKGRLVGIRNSDRSLWVVLC